MPFGFPVVPDVYRMYRMFSASIGSGGQSVDWPSTSSWYQWSRPSSQATCSPVRRTTTQVVILSVPAIARSALPFSGTTAPLR
jgi:hypothetical protein